MGLAMAAPIAIAAPSSGGP